VKAHIWVGPLHTLVTERSDLSQLTMCRPPQAGRTARVLCHNHWRGPRSVGARYKLRKVVCMEQSPPFRRVNLFAVGHWHPPRPPSWWPAMGCRSVSYGSLFSFKPQSDQGTASHRSADVASRCDGSISGQSAVQSRCPLYP